LKLIFLFACIRRFSKSGYRVAALALAALNTRYSSTKNRRQPADSKEDKMAGRLHAGPPIKFSLALGNDCRGRGGFALALALANASGKARDRDEGDQDNCEFLHREPLCHTMFEG
jgi:hypothetical protein